MHSRLLLQVLVACGACTLALASACKKSPAPPEPAASSASSPAPRRQPTKQGLREPTHVADLGYHPSVAALTFDDEHVYGAVSLHFINSRQNAIVRVPKRGGPPERVAMLADDRPDGLTLHAGAFYWMQGWSGMGRLPRGGAKTTLAVGARHFVVADATHLVACTQRDYVEVTLPGGEARKIADHAGAQDCEVAIDATDLFAFRINHGMGKAAYSAVIERVPRSGGAVVQLTKPARIASLAVDQDRVYWIEPGTSTVLATGWEGIALDVRQNADGRVLAVAKTGGEPQVVAAGEVGPSSLLLDATHVYWRTPEGIRRVARAGGTPEQLTSAPMATRESGELLADATSIYWVDDAGDLWSVKK